MEKSQSDEDKIGKIKGIFRREIEKELVSKQDEVMEITDKIEEVLRNLDILKYVVTVNYYENNPGLTSKKVASHGEESKDDKVQKQIHPCVKKLLPFRSNYIKSFGDCSRSYETRKSKENASVNAAQSSNVTDTNECSIKTENLTVNGICEPGFESEKDATNIQLPQYIPPLPNPDLVKEVVNSQRGGNSRIQHRAIIGNISKWIPPDTREDNSTHKWMVYIRNQEKDKDITQFIRKVRYFLHESYKPHDIIDVTSSPFHLTRRGWGEFPIRVQLHFHHPLNKPVDIIHHLKLDMTCSGVQTLGAETVVDLFLHQNGSAVRPTRSRKPETETEYVNGKKTKEKGDIFDGNLVTPVNGINSERVFIKEEPSTHIENQDENSVNSERSNSSSLVTNSNSMLDRRKLLEIIEREHDYCKCDNVKDDTLNESLVKLINGKNGDNDAVYKNGIAIDAKAKKGYDHKRIEVFLRKGESEVFKTLKSVVNKLEGETQSKYCMKVFKESYLVNIIQRVQATKLKTIESLIKWFFMRWPIITKLAMDQTYKHIHPYCCPSEEEFFQYNIGKQKSAEWFRAKAIQKILISLKPVIPINEEIWTTKQILLWSRFHGYSPAYVAKVPADAGYSEEELSNKRLRSNESSSESEDESDFLIKRGKSNSGKFVNGLNLIEKKKNFKRGRKKSLPDDSPFQAKSYRQVSSFSDANDVTRYGSLEYRMLHSESSPQIDVVNVDEDDIDGLVAESTNAEFTTKTNEVCLTVMTSPPDEIHINKFVSCAARQIGIRLSNEEIIPGVMCDSASRVLSQTVISFLDELLRKSLAQAWLRNGDRAPATLEYDDVLATLLEYPQFDVLTNRGLGIQPIIKSEH